MAWIVPAARKTPNNLGLSNGRLADCPNKPNCISSQAKDLAHRIPPLTYNGNRSTAREKLLEIVGQDSHATIVTMEDQYIHVTYRAMIFIDDVEFYLPLDEKVIHLRSASRVGHSDLGANLRRAKAISAAFTSRS